MPPATPEKPMRIAVLMADTPIPKVLEKCGDYGDVFRTLFRKAAAQLGLPEAALAWSKYDVVTKQEYPDLNDVDGVIITGSRYNAFDNAPWILKLLEFTEMVLAQGRVRVIGVCYGHQILGRALGVPVIRNAAWEVSVTQVQLTPKGKELFGKESGVLRIQEMHLDILSKLPKGAEPLGSTPVCKVQGMYRAGRYISVQGHPEFTGHIVSNIIESRILAGVFTDDVAADYKRRANYEHDGVAIAAGFLRFMQE